MGLLTAHSSGYGTVSGINGGVVMDPEKGEVGLSVANASPPHLGQLDALRGIACLIVLVAHLKPVSLLAWMPDDAGATGVGIFFALSGFLITRILLSGPMSAGRLLTFYNRRVVRILPVYYLTLLVILTAWRGAEVGWAADFTFNFRFTASNQDYFLAGGGQTETPPVAHFWSLCVEEHFYWVWPLVVLFLPVRWSRWVPLLVIGVTPVLVWLAATHLARMSLPDETVRGLLSRVTPLQLVALSVGALAAYAEGWLRRPAVRLGRVNIPRSAVVGAALLLVPWALLVVLESTPLVANACRSTLHHLCCSGVFLLGLACQPLGRFGPLVWVGRVSYGAYLYHLPIYATFGITAPGAQPPVWLGLTALGLTIAVAGASYYVLEARLLSWVRRWDAPENPASPARRRPYLRTFGVLITAGLLVAFCVRFDWTFWNPAPTPAPLPPLVNSTDDEPPEPFPTIPRDRVEFIVVGSSHVLNGFYPPACERVSYNMGVGSQDLWHGCHLARSQLRRLPNLKAVCLCLDSFSADFACCDVDDFRVHDAYYFLTLGIPPQGEESEGKPYSAVVIPEVIRDSLRSKWSLRDEPNRGWTPYNIKFHPDTGKRAVERHNRLVRLSQPVRFDQNVAQVKETIRACRAAGVECVLFTMPAHDVYRSELVDNLHTGMERLLNAVRKETQVRFLDFSADPQFKEDDLADGDHLNEQGAKKFSRLFESAVFQGR